MKLVFETLLGLTRQQLKGISSPSVKVLFNINAQSLYNQCQSLNL